MGLSDKIFEQPLKMDDRQFSNLKIDGFSRGLLLRSLQLGDLDSLIAIWSDPEVTRFLPSRGQPIPQKSVKQSLSTFIEHWQQRNYGIWAIVNRDSSQAIGYCGLRYLEELGEVELLYGLARDYWGRGIITQAAKASISFGFETANLKRIIALVLPENQASKRVIEKVGFDYEKQIHIFGLDVLYYSLEAEAIIPTSVANR